MHLSSKHYWFIASTIIALTVFTPIGAIFVESFFPEENIWPHLIETVLPHYIESTLILMLGVGLLSFLFGVSTAWLVTMCEFPGRRIFEWALLLPFAVPAYVIAYVYTDQLEYAGNVQTFLRNTFGWESSQDYWFPAIRSTGGCILLMSLVLYPYVYMLARSAFLEQSMSLFIASRSLGRSATQTFTKVCLPIARPAIVVGLSLVLMETLNDFGTVDYFAVKTLTAGLYDTWLNMGNIGAASQIASIMMLFVVALILSEQLSRGRQKQYQPRNSGQPLERFELSTTQRYAAATLCLFLVLLGFGIPFLVLLTYAIEYFSVSWTDNFLSLAYNSLGLSVVAAICTIIIGTTLAYSKRLNQTRLGKTLVRVSSLGYAMPGAVLAVGIIIPFAALDNAVDDFFRTHFNFSTGLLLSGTVFAIIFAYTVRFLAVSAGSIESSLDKITPSMDMASRSMGVSTSQTLLRVHLPVIRGSLLTAALVVFVDCMKELPATLILRPFNFETLATHVYQYASDELLEQSALAALLIVLAGIIPVILLSKSISKSRH